MLLSKNASRIHEFVHQTRTLLVAVSLACLEITFIVCWCCQLLFRLEYRTSVTCHNVNTQNLKFARRNRPDILASHRCKAFENLLHIDIAPVRRILSGNYIQNEFNNDFYRYKYIKLLCSGQDTARYSFCPAQEKCVSLEEPYTTDI